MEINKNPQIIHHSILKGMSPALRYDGKSDLAAWQKMARAHLIKLVGLDKITPRQGRCLHH